MKKKALILSMFISLIAILFSCGKNNSYSFAPIYVFDTTVSVIFYDGDDYKLDKDTANKYYNEIKQRLNEINRTTSDYDSNDTNTSICDLNQRRTLEVSSELISILNKAVDLIEDTNGYFNPFMGRLNHMWKDAINKNTIPSDDDIKNELEIVKNTSIDIKDNSVTIVGDGNIDLGGMVKGYALEWMRKYLDSNHVTKYVLDCGSSSIYVGDYLTNVSISKPYKNGTIFDNKVKNIGIATSSGEHQSIVKDGVRYHHLINPYTGYPSNNYDLVSIMGNIDNGMMDAYSTAIFSMDEKESEEFSVKKGLELITLKGDTARRIIY
ncbi:MAG: FAD:protein FMN transferase [Acholeplasmatales bacterium]|nr:FAD:protein FMN transferase [Acholeplasmatales bacterium]